MATVLWQHGVRPGQTVGTVAVNPPESIFLQLALHLMGYGLDNPVVKKALDGLEGFTIREDGMRRLEACQSPVWDTVLTMTALADAGLAPDDPSLTRAAQWVLGEVAKTTAPSFFPWYVAQLDIGSADDVLTHSGLRRSNGRFRARRLPLNRLG